ncbi:CRISPR-associated protein Csm3 [Pilibacter termitis]|uniref:CRISPR system Cms endoribonuclease Csm3 n=1 Tax=Pilibacter termitis TaxID=263852 RepID=A0A1T4NDR0_9ENTE|nr:type III-A CRISPR-associated RAMP protein Csm3 [Pilibacter termitis]SJZ77127.1 CRISPR-associated protein Csm3 [Pilibacter termitis]
MSNYAKVKIEATLVLESGLHIGGSSAFAAIGATDAPIIKDPLSNLPIIPGSSLKGKIRSLLAKAVNEGVANSPSSDHEKIRRLFGDVEKYKDARLLFRDCVLSNDKDLEKKGARTFTEVKFENTINRVTAVATPRQIERAIRESEFRFELIYDAYNISDEKEIEEDFQTILDGLELLEMDALGGSGSRGYGKVKFKDLQAKVVFGDEKIDCSIFEKRGKANES